jgi:hypothetical protein
MLILECLAVTQAKASKEFCCVATDVPELVVDFELNI